MAPAPDMVSTDESGQSANIIVSLARKPNGEVRLTVDVPDPSEGIASPSELAFDAQNWSQGIGVLIMGVDDPTSDGDQTYDLSVSWKEGDPDFKAAHATVQVVNRDNEPM